MIGLEGAREICRPTPPHLLMRRLLTLEMDLRLIGRILLIRFGFFWQDLLPLVSERCEDQSLKSSPLERNE